MNNQRALVTIGVATMIALAIPGIAAAHNATATPSCGGLSWAATNYDKTVTNSIVVTVDGTVVHQDADFKASDSGAHSWSQPAAHTWSVVVNAPGTQYDRSFAGTWQACVAPTTTAPSTTVGTTTTTASTDTSPLPTVVTDPTTTVVAVDIPPVALVPDEPALPRTGGGQLIAWLAAFVVVLGVAVAVGARRRIG